MHPLTTAAEQDSATTDTTVVGIDVDASLTL